MAKHCTEPAVQNKMVDLALSPKVQIGNTWFSVLELPEILRIMRHEIEDQQRRCYAAIANIHVMVLVESHAEVARIINNADLCLCDSVSIAMLGKRQGNIVPRCHGPDYVLACCDHGRQYGWRHFFVGGSDGVADRMVDELKRRFPGFESVGTFSPPFGEMTEDESEHMIQSINQTEPDIIWVGLGAGKQDKWIDTYRDRIKATWFSGVGAAFDFISGNTKRAPGLCQRLGMEWLYRFVFEPRRLAIRNIEGLSLLLKFYWRATWCKESRK